MDLPSASRVGVTYNVVKWFLKLKNFSKADKQVFERASLFKPHWFMGQAARKANKLYGSSQQKLWTSVDTVPPLSEDHQYIFISML